MISVPIMVPFPQYLIDEAEAEALNECNSVPDFICQNQCVPSATDPNCQIESIINLAIPATITVDQSAGTASAECLAASYATATGEYEAICSEY